MELYARAAALGSSQAHFHLGNIYREGGDLKKAKIHYEAAAMAGHEVARVNLGNMEFELVKELVKESIKESVMESVKDLIIML